MITTNGVAGECQVELPHNTELVDAFQCTVESKSYYRLTHIRPAMKAISCSNKVSLRTNANDLLCFQYMVKTEDGNGPTCFVEYYVSILGVLSVIS